MAIKDVEAEFEENSIAKSSLKRLESDIPPAVVTLGAVLVPRGTGMIGRAVASELRSREFPTSVLSRKWRVPLPVDS